MSLGPREGYQTLFLAARSKMSAPPADDSGLLPNPLHTSLCFRTPEYNLLHTLMAGSSKIKHSVPCSTVLRFSRSPHADPPRALESREGLLHPFTAQTFKSTMAGLMSSGFVFLPSHVENAPCIPDRKHTSLSLSALISQKLEHIYIMALCFSKILSEARHVCGFCAATRTSK
jgi:hypothetical protein